MKKIITLFCFIASMQTAFSQNAGIDTMLQKIASEKDDNRRIDIMYSSLVIIGETNPVLGLKYAQKLLDYSQINKDKIGEAYAMSFTAKMYGASGNIEKGLGYALKGKEIAEQTDNGKLLSMSTTFLGLIYKYLGNFFQINQQLYGLCTIS